MESFVVGQRWVNEAELSLGLGTLVGSDGRTVRVDFGAIGETRTYARESAALSRARFEIGDRLKRRDGIEITVQSLIETDQLISYQGIAGDQQLIEIHEMELSDFTQLNRANQRLFAGQVDRPQFYQLRQKARKLVDVIAHSETRSLTSGRTSLIPHQLFIADEVAKRQSPRVLLADEVGLGKTIEAGLILNSRLINGESQRILIIVPEPLVNQWLVEMLRRFNLNFSLYDEARCRDGLVEDVFSEELFAEDDEATFNAGQDNPFESDQLVLCSLSMFKGNPDIRDLALSAQWDMLIVDEAHHLEWSPDHASEDYLLIEQFSQCIPSVLLLTATPEQLGKEGHFARLRLLDPARFHDYQSYLAEEQGYAELAEAIDMLESDLGQLSSKQWLFIEQTLGEEELVDQLNAIRAATENNQDAVSSIASLITDLLDRHGTGRLLFRNTRSAIKGFPERRFLPYELEVPDEYRQQVVSDAGDWREELTPELLFKRADKSWTELDPRVPWLFSFLKEMGRRKVLVIAANAETALDLSEVLRVKTGIQTAVFHEHLSILERDRAAAFFADAEFGSQCLICSEIGSEGRNFQFAHDMVLFDIPANPDLLEQRIGRLDRIGQTETIKIHAPYLAGTAQSILVSFYKDALDAFEKTSIAALPVMQTFQAQLDESQRTGVISEQLIEQARAGRIELENELHGGRDRLLERNSCRMSEAERLVGKAEQESNSQELSDFVQLFSDNYGVAYEEQSNGSSIMRPTESMTSTLNGLPDEGLTLTYDRAQALSNEDMQFFTWDHPLVVSALDAVLSAELGNSTLVTMKVRGIRPGTMMLETIFVMESPSSKRLQASRYLPASRIRVMLDQSGKRLDKLTEQMIDANQQRVKRHIGAKIAKAKRPDLQNLLEKASSIAKLSGEKLRETAIANAERALDHEIERLEALKKINPSVRDDEIAAIKSDREQLITGLTQTELTLDAIRVVVFT